jgi:hypothetical protein
MVDVDLITVMMIAGEAAEVVVLPVVADLLPVAVDVPHRAIAEDVAVILVADSHQCLVKK